MRRAVQNLYIFPVFVLLKCDPLRNIRVDFTILRRPGQIFSFYKSFNALFNYHGARQEPRPQLLGHLTGDKPIRYLEICRSDLNYF